MKSLVNPLLVFLLFQIISSGLLLRQHKGGARSLLMAILFSALFFGILAMPLTRMWLESSLQIDIPKNIALSPTHIFVLGGGYQIGINPQEDILVPENQRRVLHGVAVWNRYQAARLVFSGASREANRENARQVALMRDMSLARGVSEKAIILETRSTNTREHAIEALHLPDVSALTPVGLVTSGWHMRRAQSVFCHHFNHVALYPVPYVTSPWQWQDLVPSASSLDDSTTLLREWVGLIWYAILDIFNNQIAENSLCDARP